jgi:hypothetical protein
MSTATLKQALLITAHEEHLAGFGVGRVVDPAVPHEDPPQFNYYNCAQRR